jgi:OmcA/MtrC family decaheme c-type cytochrome
MQRFMRSAALALAAVVAVAGCSGKDGKNGAPGTAGASCSIVDNGDGTATITCSGVDYVVTDGAPGATGAPGTPCTMVDNLDGTADVTCGASVFTVGAKKQTVENCAGCHNAGLPTQHVRSNQVAISNKVVASADSLDAVPVVAGDLVITFNVKVDNINRNDFTNLTRVTAWVYSSAAGAGTRVRYRSTENAAIFATFTVTKNFNGNYTVRFPGFGTGGATPAVQDTSFMLWLDNGNSQPQATVVVQYNTVAAPPVVSNQACMNCHGSFVFGSLDANGIPTGHENANPIGVEGCIVCHDRDDTTEDRLATPTVPTGIRLRGFVHGIHNSHNMPGAVDTSGVAVPGGKYYLDGDALDTFSIGFPGFQFNCSTCHDTAAGLATVAAAPVQWDICMACHIGPPTLAGTQTVAAGWAWAGFGVPNTGTDAAPIFLFGTAAQNHATFTAATNCATCHDGITAPATIAAYHNGLKTERAGLIWDGVDQSVVEGAKFALAVTGVTRVGANYEVSWTASYNGAPVGPCNTDFAVGPVFLGVTADQLTGKAASNMQFIKAYGQGDDWVNANRTGSNIAPGQPATSATLAAANTNCTVNANVAVTTTPVDTFVAAGTRGVMALQGKPQLRFAPAAGTSGEFIQARAESPTFNFVVPAADGAATAGAARRTIVDTAKCLQCHKGSLYQHGGNRVDSVPLCVTCHNPAANEMNNRVLFGVTAAEAYDGKPGEAYDMRTMVHAIHSAGETGRSYVIYRTRGIYFFGNAASLADAIANKNWPTTGGFTCDTAEGPATYYPVYGSLANGTSDRMPIVGTNGFCDTANGPILANTVPLWQIHNVVLVEYPRPLSDCGACHANGWVPQAVDATKGVGVTVDVGVAPFGNQIDDVLMGPTAASCMTCHQSGDAVTQFQLREHAWSNGWEPTIFVNGRQTLIDAVTFP